MRIAALSLVAVAGIACGTSSTKTDNNSNALADAPAVVSVPMKLPVDTMKQPGAATAKPTLIPSDPSQRATTVSMQYSLAAATMVNHDERVLGRLYDGGATLRTPDTTVTGMVAVVKTLIALAQSKSLVDFQRTSRKTIVVDDSTLTDSGSYQMVFKRTPKDSVIERGIYTARWRARTDAASWVMLDDHLMPAKGAAKPKTK